MFRYTTCCQWGDCMLLVAPFYHLPPEPGGGDPHKIDWTGDEPPLTHGCGSVVCCQMRKPVVRRSAKDRSHRRSRGCTLMAIWLTLVAGSFEIVAFTGAKRLTVKPKCISRARTESDARFIDFWLLQATMLAQIEPDKWEKVESLLACGADPCTWFSISGSPGGIEFDISALWVALSRGNETLALRFLDTQDDHSDLDPADPSSPKDLAEFAWKQGLLQLSQKLRNRSDPTYSWPEFVNMSRPIWSWSDGDIKKWKALPVRQKLSVMSNLGLEPLHPKSMVIRQCKEQRFKLFQFYRDFLHRPDLKKEVYDRLVSALSSYFDKQVILTSGGSCSRSTDVPTSDRDYYFEVPGVCVTEKQRDELLKHLCEPLNCSGKLSKRRISIELQINSTLIDLLPRNSTYFNWSHVDFPRFFGSTNRSKIEADLSFTSEIHAARVAIRELKAAFPDTSPVPSFLLERLIQRITHKFLVFWMPSGFDCQLRVTCTFDLLCEVLKELASFEREVEDPFSPLQDLRLDLQALPADRAENLSQGLHWIASCARNATWANHFLVFVEILIRSGSQKHMPNLVPLPHRSNLDSFHDYSVFMEHSVGLENYTKWLELLAKPTPIKPFPQSCRILMGNSTPVPVEAEDLLHLAELTLDSWEASMTWWNMTECEKQPWIDMSMSMLKAQMWSKRDNVILKDDFLLGKVEKEVLGFGVNYMNAIDVMKSCALHLKSIPIVSKLRKRRDEWLQRFQNTPWRARPKGGKM